MEMCETQISLAVCPRFQLKIILKCEEGKPKLNTHKLCDIKPTQHIVCRIKIHFIKYTLNIGCINNEDER